MLGLYSPWLVESLLSLRGSANGAFSNPANTLLMARTLVFFRSVWFMLTRPS